MSIFRRILTPTLLASFCLPAPAQLLGKLLNPTVTTATQGISLAQLLSATDLGPTPASQPVTVRLGLQLQNKAALQSYVAAIGNPASPLYGQRLTPAQFKALYSPSAAQVAQVTSWLSSVGFTGITVQPNNLIVSANGTAAIASAAFNTPLESYAQFGRTVFGNTAAPAIPAALGPIVISVMGLNNIGLMKPTSTRSATSTPQYLASYTAPQFVNIYGGTGTAPAAKTAIAIMAEGDLTGVISDLRIAEGISNEAQVPVTVIPTGAASTDTSGADEWDMDTQFSSGLAGTVSTLYLYDAPDLTDADLAIEFSQWVTDDLAPAASASLGECEIFPYLDGSMATDDATFLEAAAQGQTFFASAGDTGSFCPIGSLGANGVPAGAPLVQYPAASTYAIGVGGTTLITNTPGTSISVSSLGTSLLNNSGPYNSEISWYAGGGGLSLFEKASTWQTAAFAPIALTQTRAVPDIAFDADPNSGASVIVSGAAEGVGGTSLSSPSWLGIWARVLNANPKVGFAGPALYSLYNGTGLTGTYPEGGFHDIIVGVNGLYAATPGYDLNTGLGTPIISQLLTALAP
jgi:subtilase family serine protease